MDLLIPLLGFRSQIASSTQRIGDKPTDNQHWFDFIDGPFIVRLETKYKSDIFLKLKEADVFVYYDQDGTKFSRKKQYVSTFLLTNILKEIGVSKIRVIAHGLK